jgi:hypothetical protein
MPAKVQIKDGSGTGANAFVTKRGELIVAPLKYSKPYGASLIATGTPFEVVPGVNNQKFVTTGFFVTALKTVSPTTEAAITIYEASPLDLTTSTKQIVEIALIRGASFVATGANIITEVGQAIAATTDDATVNIALSGYYVSNEDDE